MRFLISSWEPSEVLGNLRVGVLVRMKGRPDEIFNFFGEPSEVLGNCRAFSTVWMKGRPDLREAIGSTGESAI